MSRFNDDVARWMRARVDFYAGQCLLFAALAYAGALRWPLSSAIALAACAISLESLGYAAIRAAWGLLNSKVDDHEQ